MMRAWHGMTRLEVARLLVSPRWSLAVCVWLVVAWEAAAGFERNAMLFGATDWSGWDVHAAAINTFMGVVLLMLPAFVIVSADGLARDRSSRFAHVLVARAGSRGAWWGAKAVAILLAAVLFHAGFLGTCLAVAGAKGASLSTATTAAGRFDFDRDTAGDDMEVTPPYPPPSPHTDMLLRETSRAGYLALAFASIAMVLAALSIGVPYVWFPAGAVIALALSDWALNWLFRGAYYRASILSRLAEASHEGSFLQPPFEWAASISIFATLCVGGVVLGWWWMGRVDL